MRHLVLIHLFTLAAFAQLPQPPKPAPTKLSPEVTDALEAHPGLIPTGFSFVKQACTRLSVTRSHSTPA